MKKLFSGKSMAKGRNGYFKLHGGEVWDLSGVDNEWPVIVDFRSKRNGDAPPIRFQLTREDAAALRSFLNVALKANKS